MKDTLTVLFFVIVLVFYEVYQALGCKIGAKLGIFNVELGMGN
jgi:hypothetical protein